MRHMGEILVKYDLELIKRG